MKPLATLVGFLIAAGGVATASSIATSAAADITIADSGGSLLDASYVVDVGWLDSTSFDGTYSFVQGNFLTLGSISFPYAGNAAYNGFYSGNIEFTNDTLAGSNPFLFFHDAAGGQWALLEFTGDQYKANTDVPNSTSADISTGTIDNFVFHAGSYNGTDQVNLVAVPEPSVVLLGALGMLGLVRRRR